MKGIGKMMRPGMMIVCTLLVGGAVSEARAETSPYAGMEQRSIKALSAQQIEDLHAGRGMGMALAAELNGYPGPAPVIELAEALKLSNEQLVRTRTLFAEMQQKAVPLGNELLSKEAELEQAFARARVDDVSLHRILGDIVRLQASFGTRTSNITSPCASCSAPIKSPPTIACAATRAPRTPRRARTGITTENAS